MAQLKQERIYVSGPMRGIANLNKDAFAAVAKELENAGFLPYNPHEMNKQNGFTDAELFKVYIRADIEAVLACDGICLLPGWRASEGSRLEVNIALALDLSFYKAEYSEEFDQWYVEKTTVTDVGVLGIDQEARSLVYGARAQTYGHPRGDFDKIAKLWSALLETDVTAEQVALMMAALKLARLSSSPDHHDSQVDVIGYILCLARVQEDPVEVAAWEARAKS